jgi:multiple sugar transport system ATP-binding protein
MNLMEGRATIRDGRLVFETDDLVIALGADAPRPGPERVRTLGVRPHDVTLVADAERANLTGRLEVVEPLGHAQIAHVGLGRSTRLVAMVPPDIPLRAGERIGLVLNDTRLHFFDEEGRRL